MNGVSFRVASNENECLSLFPSELYPCSSLYPSARLDPGGAALGNLCLLAPSQAVRHAPRGERPAACWLAVGRRRAECLCADPAADRRPVCTGPMGLALILCDPSVGWV